jgi:hypothetical protein
MENGDHNKPVLTPRTRDEVLVLLRERPALWEHLLYAAELRLSAEVMEPRYRDEVLRYAPLDGPTLARQEASTRLDHATADALALAGSLMRMFDPASQELAFGPPGESGDPNLIEQLARRTVDIYGEMLDWSRSLRSARVPTEMREAFDLAADLLRLPITQVRDYFEQVVTGIDTAARAYAERSDDDPPITVDVECVLSIQPGAIEKFTAEIDRLARLDR